MFEIRGGGGQGGLNPAITALAFVLFKGAKRPPPPKYQNVFCKLFLKLLNVPRTKTCYKNKWVRPIIKTVNCPGSITPQKHYDTL